MVFGQSLNKFLLALWHVSDDHMCFLMKMLRNFISRIYKILVTAYNRLGFRIASARGQVLYEMMVCIGEVTYQGSYFCISFFCRWGRVCPLPLILWHKQLIAI